jgi:hypothetical protein
MVPRRLTSRVIKTSNSQKIMSRPEEVTLTSLIGVEDAVSMFRRRASANERPYTVTMYKYNNDLLEDWKRDVLSAMANGSGMVRAEMVSESLSVYLEGRSLRQIEAHLDKMAFPTDSQVLYWRRFFETNTTLESLTEQGREVCLYGWKTIVDYIRYWATKEKLAKVFQNDDAREWQSNNRRHKFLMKGELLPPLLTDVSGGVRGWILDDMSSRQEMINSLQLRPGLESTISRRR